MQPLTAMGGHLCSSKHYVLSLRLALNRPPLIAVTPKNSPRQAPRSPDQLLKAPKSPRTTLETPADKAQQSPTKPDFRPDGRSTRSEKWLKASKSCEKPRETPDKPRETFKNPDNTRQHPTKPSRTWQIPTNLGVTAIGGGL
jgi:hypothetical protein